MKPTEYQAGYSDFYRKFALLLSSIFLSFGNFLKQHLHIFSAYKRSLFLFLLITRNVQYVHDLIVNRF